MTNRWLRSSLVALCIWLLAAAAALATTADVRVTVSGRNVPVELSIGLLWSQLGDDIVPEWDSLEVLDPAGNPVAYQIDDMDGNGTVSERDELAFIAPVAGTYTIRVSETRRQVRRAAAPGAFVIATQDGETSIALADGSAALVVGPDGLAAITIGAGVQADFGKVGVARLAGFPRSRWWLDGQLGGHTEETTGDMRRVATEVLPDPVVRAVIISRWNSRDFVGVSQLNVTKLYATGEVRVDTVYEFPTYAHVTKVQTMLTHGLSSRMQDLQHVLPVFRKLAWADQQGISPRRYWTDREAIRQVDGTPFIAFPAASNMQPPFWGATYIFASAEPWRANYSASQRLGIAEILLDVPPIPDDYFDFLGGTTWIYESQEFRTGIFRWIAGEFGQYEATRQVPTAIEQTVLHLGAGDVVRHRFFYLPFRAGSVEEAARWLEQRRTELLSPALVR